MVGLVDHEMLVDKSPSDRLHNDRARILRHGLVVSAFSSLEKYFESRVSALFDALALKNLRYETLGSALQRILVADAVVGLATRSGFLEWPDRQVYVENELVRLAAYNVQSPTYSSLGFSPRGSNVNEGDISVVLKALELSEPWKQMSAAASLVGSTRIDLRNDFIQLSKSRHRSAHSPQSNVATNDLRSHIENSILLAVVFDFISTKVVKSLTISSSYSAYKVKLSNINLDMRFVDLEPSGKWVERSSLGSRVVKRYDTEESAVAGATSRISVDIIIIRDIQGVPLAVV